MQILANMNTKSNQRSILVVDGSELVLNRIKKLLSELEDVKEISTAHGYDEALEIMKAKKQDVVLLELSLQDKNGFDLLTYIKKHFPSTRVIVVTNLSGDVYRAKSRELGADHFIDKSREFDNIIRIIRDDQAVAYQMN